MAYLVLDRTEVGGRPVVDVMSRQVSAVLATAVLDEALHVLLDSGSRHLVVLDGSGRVIGVIGGRHLIAAWAGDPESVAVVPVAAVLDSVPPTVAPSATLRTVARVMRDHRSDVVVVTDGSRTALGVVTADELIAAIVEPRSVVSAE